MFQAIINLLRRWAKFALMMWVIFFILWFFWQYLIFALYHLNLSIYFFGGAYLWNDTLLLLTISIVISLSLFLYKIIKKSI